MRSTKNMNGIGTTAWRLPNGKVLIPGRAEGDDGVIGDGYVEVEADSDYVVGTMDGRCATRAEGTTITTMITLHW